MPRLSFDVCYRGSKGSVIWRGHVVSSVESFRGYMQDVVRSRLEDDEEFSSSVHGMVSTGMSTEFIEEFLREVPKKESWAIGEALAECVLGDDDTRRVSWPWNMARDSRSPHASLPGADLVGFCEEEDKVLLLFGEVKTSKNNNTPPNVMYGSKGMTKQLQRIASELDKQNTLIKWLFARNTTPEYKELFESAMIRYIKSHGKDFLLVGILLRDTEPNELDVINQAQSLSDQILAPTRTEVIAWYLPILIEEWVDLLYGDDNGN